MLEIVLVMAIISFCAVMAYPKLHTAYQLRKKTYAFSSMKTIADAIRKYDLDYDTKLIPPGGSVYTTEQMKTLFAELENKGLLKVSELYQNGNCYYIPWPSGDIVYMFLAEQKGNGCVDTTTIWSPGVSYTMAFYQYYGRWNQSMNYKICDKSGIRCHVGDPIYYGYLDQSKEF